MTVLRQIPFHESPTALNLKQRLAALDDWIADEDSFRVSYRFESSSTALEFITLVGLLAEKVDLHPQVDWRADVVTLRLAHELNTEITEQDLSLARRISTDAHRLSCVVLKLKQETAAQPKGKPEVLLGGLSATR